MSISASIELNRLRAIAEPINRHVETWKATRRATVSCDNWAPGPDDGPQAIVEIATGRVIGQLQPIDPDAIAASPGIQQWSVGQ